MAIYGQYKPSKLLLIDSKLAAALFSSFLEVNCVRILAAAGTGGRAEHARLSCQLGGDPLGSASQGNQLQAGVLVPSRGQETEGEVELQRKK